MCIINKARLFAYDMHKNQRRKNYNLPYTVHLERVTGYVIGQICDDISLVNSVDYDDIVCASLLHDIEEDCGVTTKTIEEMFNYNVADMVHRLTKDVTAKNREERNKISHETLANSNDYVKLIKIADRYDNLNDLLVSFVRRQITDWYYLKYLDESAELAKHIKVECELYRQLIALIHDAKESYMDDKNKVIARKFVNG